MIQITKLLGTNLISKAKFKSFSDLPYTLESAKFISLSPLGTKTYTEVLPNENGLFVSTVLLNEIGIWKFRWECSGEFATAEEFEISVKSNMI